jgi:hypothetical protein
VKPVTQRHRRHRKAEAHDVYESASKHLNQVLEFDPEALVGPNDECPSIRELEDVNEWLYAWLDLMADPKDLEEDMDLLKAVKGLILSA